MWPSVQAIQFASPHLQILVPMWSSSDWVCVSEPPPFRWLPWLDVVLQTKMQISIVQNGSERTSLWVSYWGEPAPQRFWDLGPWCVGWLQERRVPGLPSTDWVLSPLVLRHQLISTHKRGVVVAIPSGEVYVLLGELSHLHVNPSERWRQNYLLLGGSQAPLARETQRMVRRKDHQWR